MKYLTTFADKLEPMTITQQRQAAKGRAFNKILHIYHPKSTWKPFEFPRDESYSEKREQEVKMAMDEYFKELKEINKNNKSPKV